MVGVQKCIICLATKPTNHGDGGERNEETGKF